MLGGDRPSMPRTGENMTTVVGHLTISPDVERALATIKRGSDELLIEAEFAQKLARSAATGTPLRCKLGLDPTAPDIHLGHTVVLNKLRQLQDLGHTVIFLIGDFTSMIGDPSGRNAMRPPLSREEIESNAKTYFEQATLVLDRGKTEIRYNSEWSVPRLLGSPSRTICASTTHCPTCEQAATARRAVQPLDDGGVAVGGIECLHRARLAVLDVVALERPHRVRPVDEGVPALGVREVLRQQVELVRGVAAAASSSSSSSSLSSPSK